jgi:hypothetical protein
MDRSRIVWWVRMAASAVCLALSGLLLVLWLRNFWLADVFWGPIPGQGDAVIVSVQGQMEVAVYLPWAPLGPWTPPDTPRVRASPQNTPTPWKRDSYSVTQTRASAILFPQTKVFRFRRLWNERGFNMITPYWFLVSVTWLLAAVPWIRWSTRFSLRALMIATTVVAAVLGIYVTSGW